jgi:hypothetical protein
VIGDPLSEREVLALPPLVDLPLAARALSLGRGSAYALASAGDFPVAVLRISRRTLRVRSADLREYLGIGGDTGRSAGFEDRAMPVPGRASTG